MFQQISHPCWDDFVSAADLGSSLLRMVGAGVWGNNTDPGTAGDGTFSRDFVMLQG